jgi:hypothetical protein
MSKVIGIRIITERVIFNQTAHLVFDHIKNRTINGNIAKNTNIRSGESMSAYI